MTTATPPAGWYDDPDTAGKLRWWDGSEWTERRADAPPEPADAPPEPAAAPTSDLDPAQQDAPDASSRAAVRPPDAAPPAGGFASPAHGLTPDVGRAGTTGFASSPDTSVDDVADAGTWSVESSGRDWDRSPGSGVRAADADTDADARVDQAADAPEHGDAPEHAQAAPMEDPSAHAPDATPHPADEDTGEWRVADVERAATASDADQLGPSDEHTGEPPVGEPPVDEWRRSAAERRDEDLAVPRAPAATSTAPSAPREPVEADSDVLVWGKPPVRDDHMAELASPWSRLAAYLLDTALSFVAFIVLGVATALLSILPDGLASIVGLVLTIGTWAVLFVLYVMGTGRLGQSYGKHLMGISVVSTRTGRPIGSPAAFGRGIVQTIGIYVFFLGVLWILWDPERQGWHDKAVGSVVVEDPAASRMDPLAFLRAIFAAR